MDDANGPANPDRRKVLTGAAVVAGGTALAGSGVLPAAAQGRRAGKKAAAPFTGRRKLGALEVSAIGLGVQNMSRTFHGTIPSRPEMIRIIQAAHDRGVTFFDTAEVYGPHECERILGEAAQGFRSDIVIATKFGFNVDLKTGKPGPGLISRPEHIKRVVEGPLRRLRTDRVDLLYQHRVDPTVPIEDVAGAVGELRRQGKVLHWGLSEMGLGTLRRAHAELPVTAVQSEYSLLWRGPERSVVPTCRELGIGFVPFAPLGYGFLTGAIDAETSFAPKDCHPTARVQRRRPRPLPPMIEFPRAVEHGACPVSQMTVNASGALRTWPPKLSRVEEQRSERHSKGTRIPQWGQFMSCLA